MVYSSDFYTSRRPAYYKPGSSYSVTPLYSSDGYDLPPTYYKAHQVYQTSTTPFILTPSISTGKPSPNVLPYNGYPYNHHHYVPLHRRTGATIHGVLDRIEHRPRSHPSYDPTDEYLNSRSATSFDDVTRDIRAQTAGLLKKVYTPSIRPIVSSVSNGYSELPLVQRIESDAYIEKILADSDSFRRENHIGKGHLACVSYAGGKAYPRRRPHLSKEVDDNITMLSYYNKTREAAAASSTHPKAKLNGTEKQSYKFEPTEKTPTKNYESEKETIENESALAAKKEATRLAKERELEESVKKANAEKAAQLALEKEAEEADKKAAAELEAARLAEEKEQEELSEKAAQLALEKEAEEADKKAAAELEAARLAEEKEQEELAEKAAAEEAAQLALEKEAEEAAIKAAAEAEAARLAEEKEQEELAEKAAAEEAAQLALEKEAEEEAAKKAAAEAEAARLALENESEEVEKTQEEDTEITSENEIKESNQQTDLTESTAVENIGSEAQESNAAAVSAESSTTTTSTEIINEDDGGVKTTAIFQRTVTKTTTITSSTSVVSDNDEKSAVEIQEVVEDDGEDEPNTENLDVAQAEGQESSEEEEESEEE